MAQLESLTTELQLARALSVEDLCRAMGHQLGSRRRAMGLSLAQVSADCGVTLQQIHKYETGKSAIPAAMVVRLADCLQVSAGYFFRALPVDAPARASQCTGARPSRATAGGRLEASRGKPRNTVPASAAGVPSGTEMR